MAQIQTRFITNNAVTNAKLAQIPANSYIGNNTGSTATAAYITSTQLTANLNLFSSSLQGLTPASGGGTANFLRADGTWATPPGTGITALTGDVTASGTGSVAATLTATTNSTLTTLSGLTSASSLATVGTITSGTWNGTTIAVNHGGTGVTSVTTSPTATSFAGWDSHSNLSANNFISNYATTATAAGTTTLTVSSAEQQYFTGTSTQTVTMPVTSTLVLGQQYTIINNSTGNVTVQSSGSNTIQVMAANTQLILTVISTSLTTAAAWNAVYSYEAGTNGTVTSVAATVPAFLSISGSPITTSGTLAISYSGTALPIANGGTGQTSFSSGALSSNGTTLTSGTLSIANGGTGATSVTQYGVVYGASTTAYSSTAAGTANYPLVANSSAAPTFQQLSLTAGVTGVLPIANGGTNNGSLGVTNGGVIYTDGTKLQNTGAGSSGQYLKSVGAGEPVWASFNLNYLAATSSQFTPGSGTSGTYYSLTGNSVTLTTGSWQLNGGCIFTNGGTTPAYTQVVLAWSTANGSNTSPSLDAGINLIENPQPSNSESYVVAQTVRITVASNTTIYLVPNITATTTQNARITTYIYAEQLNR